MSKSSADFGYIGSLDGLRALAILSVLIFHINEELLPGGFIGVDIFFVISGYIISRTIKRDISLKQFTVIGFYQRRIARLFPAGLVTVTLTLLVCSALYSGQALTEQAHSGFFSLVSLSNIHFWIVSDYFSDHVQTNVFLHTWSLGVEEQFYLIWPFILLLILRRISWAPLVSIALFSATLVLAFVIYRTDTSAAFYLMPARMFQFVAGALIALMHSSITLDFLRPYLDRLTNSNFLFALGTGVTLTAIWVSSGHDYSFDKAALLPTVGSMLMIMTLQSSLAKMTFGQAPFRFIGRRAYSLYLVHWPVIVISSSLIGGGTVRTSYAAMALLAAGCFVLAELLHRLVEVPLRLRTSGDHLDRFDSWRLATVFVGTAASLFVVGNIWATSMTAAPNTAVPNIAHTQNYTASLTKLMREKAQHARGHGNCALAKHLPLSKFDRSICVPAVDERNGVLITGDSFAREAFIALSEIFPDHRLLLAGTPGCLPEFPESHSAKRSETCKALNGLRFEWSERPDVSTIVITVNWERWSVAKVRPLLSRLKNTGKRIIVIGPRPVFTENIPRLLDSAAGPQAQRDLARYLRYDVRKVENMIRSEVQRLGSQAMYLDAFTPFCNPTCSALLPDGTLIYTDRAHITVAGAKLWGQHVKESVGQNLLRFSTPPKN